jgi:hypothetical protein
MDRELLYLLNRMSKRPRLVSELLGLAGDGWSSASILDFDLALERWDILIEDREAQTIEVSAPPRPRNAPAKVTVKRYKTLEALLGLSVGAGSREKDPEVEADAALLLAGKLDLFSIEDDDDA